MFQYFESMTLSFATFLIVNLVLSAVVILLERKTPTSALAWLFFLNLVPGVGFIFYILLSQNISKRKIFKYTKKEEDKYSSMLGRQFKLFESDVYRFNDPNMHYYKDIIMFHNRLGHSYYSQNNSIKIFTEGYEKFATLFADINNAKNHIHMLYFILKNDVLGNKVLSILAKKAREGVKVRLLLDFIGSRSIGKSKVKKLKEAGVEFAYFFPSKIKFINLMSNYRNHRKIVVIDGLIGYVGGFNIGDEYIGKKKRFGNWRDTHLRFTGRAVAFLQIRFFLDWRNAANEMLEGSFDYIKPSSGTGNIGMQIVGSGPDMINEQIKQGYLKMINKAKKSILIQTPYFIPDGSILEALKIAAATGLDVKLMIPKMPDHPFVYWATYSYCGELIPYGVKIYKYQNGFLHAKTIVIDGEISSVGTCNFDIRSFKLNFEVNCFIYDTSTAKELEEIFNKDLKNSEELTYELYIKRPFNIKFREAISRLLSPVL